MPTLDVIADSEFDPQKVLIWGEPFTGKTALIATLVEEGYELIYFDCDNGTSTLISHLPRELLSKITVLKLRDGNGSYNCIETCLKALSGQKYRICDEHGKIACVGCTKDSLPFTEVELTRKVLGPKRVVVFDSLSAISDSAKALISRNLKVDERLEWDHWGKLALYLSAFLTAVQHAPFHVICTAHMQEAEDESGKMRIIPICGSKEYALKLGKYFGHFVYTTVSNKKYVAASSNEFNPRIRLGSRSNLAMETGNVTLGDLLVAKPKAGGMVSDVTEVKQEDGTATVQPKQNPLQAQMAARLAAKKS